MAQIRIKNLCKEFGDFTAVRSSTFTIEDGEFFMLLGPSGCGKTTTLMSIAGLHGIDAGSIVDGARCAAEITSRTARFGGEWFAEGFVDGREFNIAVLETASGPRVLPIAEMCFVDFPADMPRIVDYAAKWDESSFAYRNTRRSFDLAAADSALLGHLQAVALRCWEVFGLAGYARVDVRVDTLGLPWVLELNANPCLAPDAGFAAAATRAGMSYATLVGAVLESAAPGLLASTRGNRLDAA